MAYGDYNPREINHVCTSLIEEHSDKLKPEEIEFVLSMQAINRQQMISYQDRDVLIGMYDRMVGDQL